MDSEFEEDDVVAAVIALRLLKKIQKKKQRKRRWWVKPWVSSRLQMGAHHALLYELRKTDAEGYRNFLRMDVASFEMLLNMVSALITRTNTRLRLSVLRKTGIDTAVASNWYGLFFFYYLKKVNLSYFNQYKM